MSPLGSIRTVVVGTAAVFWLAGCEVPGQQADNEGPPPTILQVEPVELPEVCVPRLDPDRLTMTDHCDDTGATLGRR